MAGRTITEQTISRAQGCLLGQLAGDALGSLVEFRTAEEIASQYPQRVRELQDGGAWNTIAGQPTDDSEMALALARTLVHRGTYDVEAVRIAYVSWLNSAPFDCGSTVYGGLTGEPLSGSQANGALMRISPLGIFGARFDLERVAQWAREDAALTHPHYICLDANALFAMSIAYAVSSDATSQELFECVQQWACDSKISPELLKCIRNASGAVPSDYITHQGWVVVALQNAFWQLVHAPSMEEGIIDTVMRGGDTDTNAAIAGALLGAVYGRDAVPERWLKTLLNCKPEQGNERVKRPRPSCYWPSDALELAEALLKASTPQN